MNFTFISIRFLFYFLLKVNLFNDTERLKLCKIIHHVIQNSIFYSRITSIKSLKPHKFCLTIIEWVVKEYFAYLKSYEYLGNCFSFLRSLYAPCKIYKELWAAWKAFVLKKSFSSFLKNFLKSCVTLQKNVQCIRKLKVTTII